MSNSFLVSILEEIVPEFNIQIVKAPEDISGGYLVLPNQKRCYFKSSRWDINPLGGSRVVNDKTLTHFYLKDFGYFIPKGVHVEELNLDIINEFKFPVVIKPNSGAQARGLSCMENKDQINEAFLLAKNFDNVVRIEEVVEGKHISFGVFNGKVYCAYEKEAFSAGKIVSDYTDVISDKIKDYIGKIPEIFNLKIASIDCVYTGNDDFSNPDNFVIIEVNAAPSFKKYGEISEQTRENIKLLYTDLIKFIL